MLDISQLESSLWEAADQLRANSKLNAAEYSMPVLGLIFLRHATNRFELVKTEIEVSLPSRGGKKRSLTIDDFKGKAAIYLPEAAHYDRLLVLPEGGDLGVAITDAMTAIEELSPMLQGVLPKEYAAFDPDLLKDLVRIFGRDELRRAKGDVFGRIYEYFLNKFAMSGAQEGGEFFTPPSLVRTIVNVIEPTRGKVLDPASGSAGMFVQTGHFLEIRGASASDKMTFYGQEKSETNTRLAKMNLAVHGLDGQIQLGNTFYDFREDLVGGCDFVMSNPPFNVDLVSPEKVKNDPRLFTQKKIPGISAKTKTVSNANYLWIQYFYSYLNDRGRAMKQVA
jgi:type I restriction enzyme M protein